MNGQHMSSTLMLTLCLKEESILVSSAVLEEMGFPKQIQILINDKEKMLLLRPCSISDREAIIIPTYPFLQFEMSGYSLLRKIRKITDWGDSRPRVVFGESLRQYSAILFDLSTAQPAQLQMPQDYYNPD